MNKFKLIEEIEKERKLMLHLSESHSLTSPEVIASSQKLDGLLSMFQSYTRKKAI